MARAAYMRPDTPQRHAMRQRCDLARRLGQGAPPAFAARMSGAAEDVVNRLVDDAEFMAVVVGYRMLTEQPADAALLQIARLCRGVLLRAVTEDQDAAVAAWFLYSLHHGLDPSMELAQQVLRGLQRSGTEAAVERVRGSDRSRPELTFVQAVAEKMYVVAARLRREIHAEIAAQAQIGYASAGPPPDSWPGLPEADPEPDTTIAPGDDRPQAAPRAKPPVAASTPRRFIPRVRKLNASPSTDRALALEELAEQLSPDEQSVLLAALPQGP